MTPTELTEFMADREFVVKTLGYVQADDANGIVLVEGFPAVPYKDSHKMIGCATFIPRSAIRKVRRLS